jgi:DNA-binding transcriptional LysR family regulator
MSLSRLNLNDLVALDALLTERHITRAAARSSISQSAMSHTLGRLRDVLGDPLLVRGRGGMVLTPRAAQLAGVVRRSLAELEHALFDEPAFDPTTSTRTFTIACVDVVAAPILIPLAAVMERAAPQVRITMTSLRADRYCDELERDEIDLAIVGPEPSEGMVRRVLYHEEAVCVVRRGHPVLRKTWDIDAFRGLRHVVIDPHGRGSFDIVGLLATPIDIALRVPYFMVGPIVVASSDMALMCSRRLAVAMGRDFPLHVLPMPVPMPPMAISKVWHPKRETDPALRWLRETIASALTESMRLLDEHGAPPRSRLAAARRRRR